MIRQDFVLKCLVAASVMVPVSAATSRLPETNRLASVEADAVQAPSDLIWRPCPEGQVLSSRGCEGSAKLFSRGEALALFDGQRADTKGWRLPNSQELQQWGRQLSRDASSAPDANTPSSYWAFSPDADHRGGWVVSVLPQQVTYTFRRTGYYAVRLVKSPD